LVSYDIMYTNDLDKHTSSWYTSDISYKTVER